MPKNNEVVTYSSALEKLKKYCAYQERCQSEVRKKLISYGLSFEEAESAITVLIQENYLNEERFARAYVRGKYKFKKWGRRKIEMELKSRDITTYCIKKGFEEIDQQEYFGILYELAEKKWPLTKGRNEAERKQKLFRYLMGRGFEGNLISEVLETILE